MTENPNWNYFKGMTVDALRAEYEKTVGRPTGSDNAAYLRWKIRQAIQGKVPVGPVKLGRRATAGGSGVEDKTVPLRLTKAAVDALDGIATKKGLATRTSLLRKVLKEWLLGNGETDAAALIK